MRIAVIGAGAAGLAAAKALCEVGIAPVVYESSADIGGLWNYCVDGQGPAYRSLRTNTSKQVTAFSDTPFPGDLPDFPSWNAVVEYLQRYAAVSGLLPLVRFGHRVVQMQPEESHWRIRIDAGGFIIEEIFDAVLVCTGIFRQPIMPAVPGLDSFTGQVLHSIQYREPERFAERDMLVVGLGSSAVDIAIDLLETANSVTLSTRRGSWVAPRIVDGRPFDHRGTRLSLLMPESLRMRRRRVTLEREYSRRGIEPLRGLWARNHVPFDPETAPSVTNDEVLPAIASGRLGVRPGIERVEGTEVVFADGGRTTPEVIVFCTGYRLDFPFLPVQLQPWTDTSYGLYRLVFPPVHHTLAFIGVCRVHGPILPIVEMQARWAARVLVGGIRLPSPSVMQREIEERRRRQTSRGDSLIRVPLIPYLDQIAEVIGARPHVWKHPDIAVPLLTGPPVSAQYRLEGPNPCAGAREAVASTR